MEKFWIVTLFGFQPAQEGFASFEAEAIEKHGALGIEEFSLDEPEVDALLGDRSNSGGDLPLSVLDEVESSVLGKPANYRFFFDDKESAENFKHECQRSLLAEVQVEEQDSQDWNAEWKKHYAPVKVNETLEIIPSWMKDFKSQAKHQLYINPGMGFGTGSHETTFLCLKLFTEEAPAVVNTVLDFGSGSGILGLAALMIHQNAEIDFYDIDPEANKNCYQNAELNHLESLSFRLLLPEFREKLRAKYDVVFANILQGILLEERESLVSQTAPNGILILSGLLKHQMDEVVRAYESLGVSLKTQVTKGDWGALSFTKG